MDCAVEVHRQLGPGLFRDVYETCLAMELTAAGLPFERGRVLPVVYDGHQLAFRCQTDLIVANSLILQVEAADEIELIHEQRLRTGLWAGGLPLGLLLNFNVVAMVDGITQMISNAAEGQPPPTHDVFEDPDLGSTL
jgi:GxxExxY protein